jgi:predicted RNase H-like HicB family nuclease
MRYAMIIESGNRNYSAYLPDVPGCVATGKTIDEVRERMREAVELHLAGMREDGLPSRNPQLSLNTLNVQHENSIYHIR